MLRTPDETIGQRIQLRRTARGWSIRFAASRAGISHTTWSRIERGERSADNRFLIADMAAALECSVVELTGHPATAVNDSAGEARAGMRALRQALVEADLSEEPVCAPRPLPELARLTDLVMDLNTRCDFAGATRLLPDLIRELHAAAQGADRRVVLRQLVLASRTAQAVAKTARFPAETWLAAERCRQAAEALDDPVMLALGAWSRADAAIECDTYARGLAIGSRAVDDLRGDLSAPGALELLGSLQVRCGYAALGNRRLADSLGWLDEAAEVAARTGQTSTCGLFFGPAMVNMYRVPVLCDGGEPAEAVRVADVTSVSAVRSPAWTANFHSDVARSLATVGGQDGRAIRHLLTAERVGPQQVHLSPFARETARVLLERSRRRAGGSAVAGLCERMGMPV